MNAFNLFAAFNTRTGEVTGIFRRRKRQLAEIPAHIMKMHLVCDNVSIHKGKVARTWLAAHPRFAMHFMPVHYSWMNQLTDFIAAWNRGAEPFKWRPVSFDKVLAGRAQHLAPAQPDRVACTKANSLKSG